MHKQLRSVIMMQYKMNEIAPLFTTATAVPTHKSPLYSSNPQYHTAVCSFSLSPNLPQTIIANTHLSRHTSVRATTVKKFWLCACSTPAVTLFSQSQQGNRSQGRCRNTESGDQGRGKVHRRAIVYCTMITSARHVDISGRMQTLVAKGSTRAAARRLRAG